MNLYKVRFDASSITAVAKDIASLYDLIYAESHLRDIMSFDGKNIYFKWTDSYTEEAHIEEIDLSEERIIQAEYH